MSTPNATRTCELVVLEAGNMLETSVLVRLFTLHDFRDDAQCLVACFPVGSRSSGSALLLLVLQRLVAVFVCCVSLPQTPLRAAPASVHKRSNLSAGRGQGRS